MNLKENVIDYITDHIYRFFFLDNTHLSLVVNVFLI